MLQIGLVLLLPLLILGGVLGFVSFWWAGCLAVLFFATMIPFCIRAFRRDPIIGLISPVMLAFRAVALGAGLVLGSFRLRKDTPDGKDHEKHDKA